MNERSKNTLETLLKDAPLYSESKECVTRVFFKSIFNVSDLINIILHHQV